MAALQPIKMPPGQSGRTSYTSWQEVDLVERLGQLLSKHFSLIHIKSIPRLCLQSVCVGD